MRIMMARRALDNARQRRMASNWGWVLATVGLVVAALFANFASLLPVAPGLSFYLLQPLLYLTAGMLIWWLWRTEQTGSDPIPTDKTQIVAGAILGAIQVALLVIAGIILGFGRSPYGHSLAQLLLNLWSAGIQLAVFEFCRWYLMHTLGHRHASIGALVAWLIPFVLTLPLLSLRHIDGTQNAFQLIGTVIMPGAGESLLATSLAGLGGPFASIAYRGFLIVFQWASPILPNLSWQVAALIGAVVPLVGLFCSTDLAQPKDENPHPAKHARGISGSDLALVATGVAILWFNSGLLGVRPALISGHSMEPLLHTGDVVVCRQITADKIVVGDVIRFKSGNATVMHRVLEITEFNGHRTFTTKGDNNLSNDAPVDESQLMGRAIFFIHRIGWVVAWPGNLLRGLLGK
jgi:signal peptidase